MFKAGANRHRPEAAYKRAEELLAVGQKGPALQQLHDVVTNKRYRVWQPTLEKMMLKHIELSVEMKQARLVKDALLQFKTVCQSSNVASLELVIRRLTELAQAHVAEAQEKSAAKQLEIRGDLEEGETPEELMLASVTAEDNKDRTDREVVTPWLKFLWETYRLVLDVLRNNVKLEALYHTTAHQAFQFCLKYERKSEFRRLCDMLRLHLVNLSKYSHQQHAVSLNNVESLQLHIDTRFAQLNAAVQLELWQESSRTVGDLFGLMANSKKIVRPNAMAVYHDKMAQIFLVSENWLMHAFAIKLHFQKSRAKLSPEDRVDMASAVVLAALAAPLDSTQTKSLVSMVDGEGDTTVRNLRLAEYLYMTKTPTRELLMSELAAREVLENIHAPVRELHRLLEKDFDPLTLCHRMVPILEFLRSKPQFERYIRPIQDVALTRVLQQLSQIYRTVRLDTITKLVPFDTLTRIEMFLMDRSRRGDLQAHVDHLSRTITFEAAATVVQTSDGRPTLQTEEYRTQLTTLSKRLQTALELITPADATASARRSDVAARVRADVEKERAQVLHRRGIIDSKKEELQSQQSRLQHEAARERRLRMEREAEQERKRLAEESKRREMERLVKEREAIEREQKLKLAMEMKRKSEAAGLKLDLNELEELDTEQLVAKQVEQLEAEKREMRTRLTAVGRKMDHLERAIRKEELALFAADYEQQQKIDRQYYDEQVAQAAALAKEQHEKDLALRERLLRMADDARSLRESILEHRRADLDRRRADALARLEAEKARRREEFRKAKEEEARQLREEEERREQLLAEAEARRAEEEQLMEERRLREQELRAQAAEQRAKLSEALQAAAAVAAGPAPSAPAPVAAGGNAAAPGGGAPASGSRYMPPALRAAMAAASTGAAPPGDLPPRDLPSRDLPPRDLPSRDLPPRDLPSRELPPRDLPSRELPPRDLPPRELPSRDLPPQGTPSRAAAAAEGATGGSRYVPPHMRRSQQT